MEKPYSPATTIKKSEKVGKMTLTENATTEASKLRVHPPTPRPSSTTDELKNRKMRNLKPTFGAVLEEEPSVTFEQDSSYLRIPAGKEDTQSTNSPSTASPRPTSNVFQRLFSTLPHQSEEKGSNSSSVLHVDEPQNGHESLQQNTTSTTTNIKQRGRKRDDGSKDDDPSGISQSRRPFKMPKTSVDNDGGYTEEGASVQFQALDFSSAPHPDWERSDDWFETAFTRYRDRIIRYSAKYFSFTKLATNSNFTRPWSWKMPPELVDEIESVSVADPYSIDWDRILLNHDTRCSLVAAVIAHFLERRIFDEDLFGGTEEEKQALRAMDRALVSDGGYIRTALRSQMVRAILMQRPSPVTKNFELEVCRLTSQLHSILEPLIKFLHSSFVFGNEEKPKSEDALKDLHNLIANAAFLSICIRLSATIFHPVHNTPGEACDIDSLEQYILHNIKLYDESKDAFLAARKQGNKAEVGNGIKAPYSESLPLVQISVFPQIQRFKPGNGEPGGENKGFRIYDLMQGAVMLYHGEEKSNNPQRVTLKRFLREQYGYSF